MIKECPVTLNNGVVTVVKFGDIFVQLPSVSTQDKTILVKYDDGKYTVVQENTEVKTDKEEKVYNQLDKKTTKIKSKSKKAIAEN